MLWFGQNEGDDKLSLKQQEKILMNKLEQKGLKRIVQHEYYGQPESITYVGDKGKKITRYFTSKTVVLLEKEKKKGYTVGVGESKCSVVDHFNKRLGRVIATGRAYKQVINKTT